MHDFFSNEFITLKKNLQTCFNEDFKEFNLKSSEIKLIHILSKIEGESQAELAKKLDCDKAHIHRIVIKLLLKKIVRFSNEKKENHRNVKIILTESGKEIANKINKNLKEWKSKLIKGVNEQDIETVKKVINQIGNNLKKEKENA